MHMVTGRSRTWPVRAYLRSKKFLSRAVGVSDTRYTCQWPPGGVVSWFSGGLFSDCSPLQPRARHGEDSRQTVLNRQQSKRIPFSGNCIRWFLLGMRGA